MTIVPRSLISAVTRHHSHPDWTGRLVEPRGGQVGPAAAEARLAWEPPPAPVEFVLSEVEWVVGSERVNARSR